MSRSLFVRRKATSPRLIGIVCLALIASQACIPLNVLKRQGVPFSGLAGVLKAWPNLPLKVLVVHGMGMHKENYADQLMGNLATRLSMRPTKPCQYEVQRITHAQFPDVDYGSLQKCDYDRSGQSVTFYVLTWSPLTTTLKQRYLAYDWTTHQYTRDRLAINKELKETLIDQALSDPVLYAAPFRPHMQYPIQQAICFMTREHSVKNGVCSLPFDLHADKDVDHTNVIITFSLGSMMVYRTIEDLLQGTYGMTAMGEKDSFKAAAERFAGNTDSIFMLANQLPLLRLADIQDPETLGAMLVSGPPPLPKSLKTFVDSHYSSRAEQEKILIVAFSDPNDLFSYPIRPTYAVEPPEPVDPRVTFTNVLVSVAKDGWLYLFADPFEAHEGYANNPNVIQKISCGAGELATC